MRYVKTVIAAAISLLAIVNSGYAADMDEPILVEATDEYKPVEVGSSWYLRGDIGYAFNNEFERIQQVESYDSKIDPFSAGIGVGYHFNDFLRTDLTLGILPGAQFKKDDTKAWCIGYRPAIGTGELIETKDPTDPDTPANYPYLHAECLQSDDAENRAYDAMANVYVDLGTYSGITPYIGGGLGVLYTTTSLELGKKNCISDQNFQCSTDPTKYMGTKTKESEVNLQFALSAGVSYRVTQAFSVDLGYEYKFSPDATYYSIGDGGVLETNKGLDFHSAKLGFRYDLW